MVRIHPDPPIDSDSSKDFEKIRGAIAQLGERLLCKQEVIGSIPIGSTSFTTEVAATSARSWRSSVRLHRALRLFFNNLE